MTPRVITLNEHQEMSIASFDESAPLIRIDNIRHALKQNTAAAAPAVRAEEQESTNPTAAAAADGDGISSRPRRNVSKRTMEIIVEGVGVVDVLNTDESTRKSGLQPRRTQRDVLEGFVRRDKPSTTSVVLARPSVCS